MPSLAADVKRGEYLFAAAGCKGCHTDVKHKGPTLAGGRKIVTSFGIFYSPNITPDREHGIGKWSDADFIRALRLGVSPEGRHYFPVFPYPSYTGITDKDLLDIKAYLFTRPPNARANKPHDINPLFGQRFLVAVWKTLYFKPGPFKPSPEKSVTWNRGSYLTNALGHCAECHTPRNSIGAIKQDFWMAGTNEGPQGGTVPNITPDRETGIGRWPKGDLEEVLQTGLLPDGDFVGDAMGEVVDDVTGKLISDDIKAIAAYLRSLPPIRHKIGKKGK
ncbi:MAG: cytochrome c [Rhodospirillales bacterium]|nr:cytochrome c [Rhodospirillales bacterium]